MQILKSMLCLHFCYLTATLKNRDYYLHFTSEETEAQNNSVTRPRSQSQWVMESGLEPMSNFIPNPIFRMMQMQQKHFLNYNNPKKYIYFLVLLLEELW